MPLTYEKESYGIPYSVMHDWSINLTDKAAYAVLSVEGGTISAEDLAYELDVSTRTAERILKRLRDAGHLHVAIRPTPDGRQRHACFSRKELLKFIAWREGLGEKNWTILGRSL